MLVPTPRPQRHDYLAIGALADVWHESTTYAFCGTSFAPSDLRFSLSFAALYIRYSMATYLPTYLNDHRAGARFAIELLGRIRNGNSDQQLNMFAAELLPQIEADYVVLEGIADQLAGDVGTLKEMAGWLAEKASRVKLDWGGDASIGAFESLEMLSLGILGKLKLWQVLSLIAVEVPCLSGIDFERLQSRAQTQHDKVEALRREVARTALV